MKKLKLGIAVLLGTLAARIERLRQPRESVALANALGLFNENGIESLLVDPASSNLPFAGRYLLIQRGASGYQYGDVCAGGAGGAYPLGISSDSPYAVGDILNVRRLHSRPGIEMGIAVAGKTVTIDKLLVSAAGGAVQDITTVTVNGTYWVVGRAAASLTTTGSLQEVPFIPITPYQITVSNGGGTYALAGAGV